MKKKRIEFIIATMLVAFLLISIPGGYAQSVTESMSEEGRTIAVYGKEAESFASLISSGTDLKVTSGVIDGSAAIIISDLRNVDMGKVAYALRNRAIVVALNLPANNDLVPAPALEENTAGVEFMIDSEDGTVLSERIIQESTKTIYPEYWIGIIQHDEAISVSYYALLADSPQQLVKLFETTAEKVANMVLSGTYAEAFSSYPEPGSEWAKKYEVEYTFDLAGDDQLYTRYEVFELKFWDEVTMKEYWRTDSYIDHWLPSYVQQMGHCGPYMHTRHIIVDAASADLYDYDPPTTATGAGASVSIGFTVSTGGVGVNVGYSWSWSNPGVRYDVGADYVNDKITWDETFNGPDYTWWPIYGGPTEASHNSYNAKTTAIMRSPVGNGYDVSTLKSEWIKYDDFMTWNPLNPFIWWLTRYTYTYTNPPWSPGQLASMFVPPNTPSTPSGPTSGYTGTTYTYTTTTTDPNGDSIWYKFSWYDGSYTTVGPYVSGATASASHSWSNTGTYYVRVRAKDSAGLWSDWSSSRAVSISSSGGGGGGECPYVSVWDGNNYVLDNSILPTSQLGNGADVEDYYRLEQTLVRQDGKYQLLISEFEKEHSYIDQVKLLAVDHESDVNIAVAPDGEFLTYKDPVAPLSAVDVSGTDRLDQIRYMDGNLSDPATFFQGTEDDYLLLNFGQVNSENAKLIVRNDMYCMIKCINVQVMDSNGEWQTVAVIASRTYWAVEGVDLSPYVVEGRDLLVRLGWTMPHKLDYVGLDTTKQDDCELHEANLVSATHSTQGDVKGLLQEGDNTHAELIPGQQIQLEFTLPNNSKQARTYILYTKGHWYTIQA